MDDEVAALVSVRFLREKCPTSRIIRLLTTVPECAKPAVSTLFGSLLLFLLLTTLPVAGKFDIAVIAPTIC
jgi:hypothetical protein